MSVALDATSSNLGHIYMAAHGKVLQNRPPKNRPEITSKRITKKLCLIGNRIMKLGKGIPQLPSGNIEVTAEFFESKLGFKVEAVLPDHGHLILARDDAEIHFWRAENESHARTIGSDSSCYIRVENVSDLYTELKGRNAPFRYELTEQPWGMNEMQIDDPFGNAIRFGEPVAK